MDQTMPLRIPVTYLYMTRVYVLYKEWVELKELWIPSFYTNLI